MNKKYVVQIPLDNLYLHLNGNALGPLSLAEIREKVQNLEITRATFLWFGGLENWITVGDIPEFDRRNSSSSIVPNFPLRANDLTITLKGKVVPLKTEAVKALIEHHEFRRADLVFLGTSEVWVRADQHPAVRPFFNNPVPPNLLKD